MRKKTSLLSIAMLSAAVSIAQNFTAVYNFTDVTNSSGLTDPTPVPIATGVAFGGFSAVGASANSNAGGRFSFTKWPTGATNGDDTYSSLTGAVDTSEYYQVTIAPENGYTLDLTDISFAVQRSGTGIRTYVVRSSMDGYVANLSASINPANVKLSVQTGDVFFWNLDATITNQTGSTITLGGVNFSNLSNPVTFRFYGYNSEGNAGTFSIDNVTFTGTATSISTSIANSVLNDAIKIYPNPSVNGMFMIDMGNIPNETIIIIRNILGEKVFEKQVNTLSGNIIDLSDKANGSYSVIFKNDDVISTQTIIINK